MSFGSSLRSVTPLDTGCGKFMATVRLDGVQPITQMIIRRENENGGRFSGPLWLNVKVSFTPVDRVSRESLEIPVEVRFPAKAEYPWRNKPGTPEPVGFVLVDTDGDRVADTYLPGTSNFFAGQASRQGKPGAPVAFDKTMICHDTGTSEQHCTRLCDGCQIP